MTKKAIVVLVAVGVVAGLRPASRRIAHTARDHCEQMAEQCMQMAAQFGGRGEAVGSTRPPLPTASRG